MKSVVMLSVKNSPEQGMPSNQEGIVFMHGITESPGALQASGK